MINVARSLAIVGPTAVGKTAMSIKIARKFNGEVISGDSMQVYRGLDIGTAKVTNAEKQGIVHHLIDIRNIDERYSVANFVQDANDQIKKITNKGKLPIIVGGTGFYLQALLNGLQLGGDQYTDDRLRQELLQYADTKGNAKLHARLEAVDPQTAQQIPVNNVRRVVRALEVYIKTGHRFSDQEDTPQLFNAFVIGLNTNRQLLYQRINRRVDQMITAGLVDEARMLFDRGGVNFQSGKGIGYRELFNYFAGNCQFDEAVEQIKKDSRHYAKRQLTWFRNKTRPNWYNVIENPVDVQRLMADVDNWLTSK
ncbi:tRNA dimethylallyltransferase [Lentilactobacillus kisonensis F0435]|uniref:tRNA dimethylallyltransferase n=1 Tax=Lentilactobacillus kisonensis F0435 TaxID=797516 RepID=H1LGG2_9LACO|nr:tRNA dimethylallyltransferase [Lentilactobacillus kisonensis F0435]